MSSVIATGFCDLSQQNGVKDRKPGDYIPSMPDEVKEVDEAVIAAAKERELLAGLRGNTRQ